MRSKAGTEGHDAPDAMIRVLRAIALLGAAAVSAHCNRTASTDGADSMRTNPRSTPPGDDRSAIAGTQCGSQMPSEGATCEGHTVGHECEWSNFLRCTCTQTEQGPQWKRCMARSVPGPLPPPELSA